MLREEFGLGFDDLRKLFLHDLRDPGMQVLALGLEQRAVGGVLDQRVLEAVGGIGRGAAAIDQLGRNQLVQRRLQLRLGPVGDRGEQPVGELAPERGADLGDLFHGCEAVEAGEQRVMQGRWQRERWQRPGQLVVVARVREQARFEHRLGQLLDEQRHAVGLGHDLRRDLVRQRLVPDHPPTRAAPSRRPSRESASALTCG